MRPEVRKLVPSIALAGLLAAAALAIFFARRGGAPREPAPRPLPPVLWTDVTALAGISFRHEAGARGEMLNPETFGSGAGWLDYDGDGRQDLLLVNSNLLRGEPDPSFLPILYRNLGGGRFEDVTRRAGLAVPSYGMGFASADVDGDGDQDLLLYGLHRTFFFQNGGDGRFRESTAASGLADGDRIPSGTAVLDLSGNLLNATVEANDAPEAELVVNAGDSNFDVPAGSDRECDRAHQTTAGARVAVNDDRDSYEMGTADDFSIELYVGREDVAGTANWGILAGTWHSRNLVDDVGNPETDGAWYGYGLISVPIFDGHPNEAWQWILSPVVDGVPSLGLSGVAERKLPEFDIPPGRHYVVLTVDRTLQSAVTYVDGAEVARMDGLDPTWDFTTPPGRDHARFMMFNAENDPTRGSYMPSPQGTHLDAVRVQRKALDAFEVNDNWGNIQLGIPSPPSMDAIQAVLVASGTNLLMEQCALLSGEASAAGPGKSITKWEWKVGSGVFEEGTSTREVSFPAASPPEGGEVTLRITNSSSETSTTKGVFHARPQPAVARIAARIGVTDLPGKNLIVPVGTVLSLDGSGSSSTVPPEAIRCPLSSGDPVPPSPISEHRWDLDGNGTTDDTRVSFDLPPLNTVGEFKVTLTVKNEAGVEGSDSIDVKVIASQGNSEVFHDTTDTIFHVEFNEVAEGVAADGTVFPDLSASGLQLTMADPAGGGLQVEGGALQFDDNRAIAYVGGGNGPRGEVRDDGDMFEMSTGESFTFELYVKPGDDDQPAWGDMAGTFKARTDGTEGSARYGWGIIKSALNNPAGNTQGYALILCYGNGQPAEHQLNFQVEEGAYNYVACIVDRATQNSRVYVNGVSAGDMPLQPIWTFETPPGFPHAPFYLFSREQVTGAFSNCPSPMAVDALRLQLVALTQEQVAANWENIESGRGADPTGPPPKPEPPTGLVTEPSEKSVRLSWTAPASGPAPTGYAVYRDGTRVADVAAAPTVYQDSDLLDDSPYCYRLKSKGVGGESDLSEEKCTRTPPAVTSRDFKRGDVDGNNLVELTDVINSLGYQFLGTPDKLDCFDAADADDNKLLELTDAIVTLGFLYLGTAIDLVSPGAFVCGPDADVNDTFPDCVYACQ